MSTDKIAISIPSDMVSVIDRIRSKRGVSRSKFITLLLREKLMDEQEREVREAYDRVFSTPPSQRSSWRRLLSRKEMGSRLDQ